MATATPLTAVARPAASVSETLATQLLEARVKISQLIEDFDTQSTKALADAQRAAVEQAAQALARTEKPEIGLVSQLADRVQAVASLDEQARRHAEHLALMQEMIEQRIEELKDSTPERALLVKLLKSQRDKLDAEIKSRAGGTSKLEELLRRVIDEIARL